MIIDLPVCKCPKCDSSLDATQAAFGDHRPKAGDITICLYCGHLMAFTDTLTLRGLGEEEYAKVISDPRVAEVVRARSRVMKKHVS